MCEMIASIVGSITGNAIIGARIGIYELQLIPALDFLLVGGRSGDKTWNSLPNLGCELLNRGSFQI